MSKMKNKKAKSEKANAPLMSPKFNEDRPWDILFGLSAKLAGIGELIAHWNGEVLAENEVYGIGMFLKEVAGDLDDLLEHMESRSKGS